MKIQLPIIGAAVILSASIITASLILTPTNRGSNQSLKEFNIVMQNNQYIPSEIVANVGDQVVINFANQDPVSHGVAIPEFNATVPGGHIPAGGTATMQFVASRPLSTDAAVCGGPNPADKSDGHGEELNVRII